MAKTADLNLSRSLTHWLSLALAHARCDLSAPWLVRGGCVFPHLNIHFHLLMFLKNIQCLFFKNYSNIYLNFEYSLTT